MIPTIAIANQKGGVGKTTTTINLGAALSERGRRTLLVDMDPQFNCTMGMGVELPDNNTSLTIYNLLKDPKLDPHLAIINTNEKNLDIIPASIDLAGAELQLPQIVGGEKLLQECLLKVTGYDYILIDCPPSLGRLTLNALSSATHVLIPIQCGKWALTGTSQLLETIKLVRTRLNYTLEIIGVLCTMYDARTSLSKEVLAQLKVNFGDKLFKTITKMAAKVGEATVADMPVIAYARSSESAKSYRDLAEELEQRIDQKKEPSK